MPLLETKKREKTVYLFAFKNDKVRQFGNLLYNSA